MSSPFNCERLYCSRRLLYKKLKDDHKEIRLLCVRGGEQNAPIVCSLRHASLKDDRSPSYETISYCWGDATVTATIEIDNVIVTVPISSAAAIRRTRLPDRDRVLWIDSVCINQQDLDERIQLVAMMGEVYSSSTGNLVYLGEGDAKTGLGVQSIKNLMAEIRLETDDFRSVEGTAFGTNDRRNIRRSIPTCELDSEALESFFALPWFR